MTDYKPGMRESLITRILNVKITSGTKKILERFPVILSYSKSAASVRTFCGEGGYVLYTSFHNHRVSQIYKLGDLLLIN